MKNQTHPRVEAATIAGRDIFLAFESGMFLLLLASVIASLL